MSSDRGLPVTQGPRGQSFWVFLTRLFCSPGPDDAPDGGEGEDEYKKKEERGQKPYLPEGLLTAWSDSSAPLPTGPFRPSIQDRDPAQGSPADFRSHPRDVLQEFLAASKLLKLTPQHHLVFKGRYVSENPGIAVSGHDSITSGSVATGERPHLAKQHGFAGRCRSSIAECLLERNKHTKQ
ncbi:hypothetical protein E5288_WYG019800 [Bos mutus]|uniref:Uncharacterized protein n=1 Tax=Bos mutus TaxID=72004 RepID=A0A6B0RPM9_9CETA|nr:hypothetical protein [Bos mutus]